MLGLRGLELDDIEAFGFRAVGIAWPGCRPQRFSGLVYRSHECCVGVYMTCNESQEPKPILVETVPPLH